MLEALADMHSHRGLDREWRQLANKSKSRRSSPKWKTRRLSQARLLTAARRLRELTGEVERLFAHAEALDELAALSSDEERSNQLKREAAEERNAAAKKEKRAERLSQKLEGASEKRQRNVRRAVRQGLAEAMAGVEQANDAVNAFGGGYDAGFGTENGAGGRNSLSTKEKFVIAQQMGRPPKPQQIAAVCGRFTRIALQQQKTTCCSTCFRRARPCPSK